jgi:hypothetical protein
LGTAGRGTSTHPTAFAVLAHTISIAARASMVRDDILDACGARARRCPRVEGATEIPSKLFRRVLKFGTCRTDEYRPRLWHH